MIEQRGKKVDLITVNSATLLIIKDSRIIQVPQNNKGQLHYSRITMNSSLAIIYQTITQIIIHH